MSDLPVSIICGYWEGNNVEKNTLGNAQGTEIYELSSGRVLLARAAVSTGLCLGNSGSLICPLAEGSEHHMDTLLPEDISVAMC